MSQEPTPTQRKTIAWEHAKRLVTDACGPGPVAAGDILAVANWLADGETPTPADAEDCAEGDPCHPRRAEVMSAPIVYDITLDGQKILDALKRRDDGQAKR